MTQPTPSSGIDFSKFTDADLEAYESGDYSTLSDNALSAIDAHEARMNEISAKMKSQQDSKQTFGLMTPGAATAGALLGGAVPRTAQAIVDTALPVDLRGGYHPHSIKAPVNPTISPIDTSYHSPYGAGQGAVKNAVHNVDEVLKNRAAQAAAQTPGFVSPGNSLILMPESVAKKVGVDAGPAPTATPTAPLSVKQKAAATLPKARAALRSEHIAPAHRLGTAFKSGAVGGFGANTIENLIEGDYGDAATSAAGTASALAAMSSNPKISKAGKFGLGAAILGKGYQTMRDWKKPEPKPVTGLQGFADGNIVKAGLEALKKSNAASKSGARLAREAAYKHDIRPIHQFGEAPKLSIQDLQGRVLVGVPGDRSLTGHELHKVAGVPLSKPVELHGGPRYGQKQLEEGNKNFWASNAGAASGLQDKAALAAERTGMDPYGMYVAMAPDSSNFALHHTEALINQLDALNPRKRDIEAFNKEIRQAYPSFFGLQHPDVMEQLKNSTPEMRKLIAARLNKQSYFNDMRLPSGEATIHAITEPALRDVATGTTGFSVGKLAPKSKLSLDVQGIHPTYDTQIPGEFKGEMIAQLPWEYYFPDAAKAIAASPKHAPHAFGTFKMGKSYNQPVTQELIDTIAPIEEQILKGYAGGKKVVEAGLKALEPKETVKAYKLFRTDPKTPESLYPLFVNANKPVPMGQWLPAEAGELTAKGKVKSKIGDLAYRPGWHAGDMPIATHIGGKSSPELTAPDFRPSNQVWAEVEMPADVDWQSIAMERAQRNKAGDIIPRTAHITDAIPEGGHYRYKTNPNMTGDWLIGGSMKVNRVLTPEEVMAINEAKGVADLPRFEPLPKKADGGVLSKDDITPEMWDWILKYGRDESLATDDGMSQLGLGNRGVNKTRRPTTKVPFDPNTFNFGFEKDMSLHDLDEFKNQMGPLNEGDYMTHLAEGGKTPAWQRKEGKNPEGGLNAVGRASYNRETGGNLKAPQPEGGPRKKSFCARMEGMKRKNTSAATANDPDSRINKSLRKWKC